MEPLRVTREHDGGLLRLVLDRPKANVLDAPMIAALRRALAEYGLDPALRCIVLEGAGAHFSFGASVEEHLPAQAETMLQTFHALFRELENAGVPTAAVVRGLCLGGGAELALWCGRVFCTPDATFGLPEIRLGVFPPMAALLLPWRVTGPQATELVLSGRQIRGPEALPLGLVDRCELDPESALQAWYSETLAPRSAFALRQAWRAVRRPLRRALERDLPGLEALYLEELMPHPDAEEGLRAFLERRPPRWSAP